MLGRLMEEGLEWCGMIDREREEYIISYSLVIGILLGLGIGKLLGVDMINVLFVLGLAGGLWFACGFILHRIKSD